MSEIKLKAGWLRDSIEQAGKKLKQVSDQTYSDDEQIISGNPQEATTSVSEPPQF